MLGLTILGVVLIVVPVAVLMVAFLVAVGSWQKEKEHAKLLSDYNGNLRGRLRDARVAFEVKVTDLRERLAEEHTALEAARRRVDGLMIVGSVTINSLCDDLEELKADLEESEDDLEESEKDVEEIYALAESAIENAGESARLTQRVFDLFGVKTEGS